ncbi:radical SAM-associated putative lipoprotein [uncultured Alistipes sp.]|jgi:putative lipoprotein (rSAM/lipoprotein system)|uniref:radical SAM-associated putative lipoprotein n=1 Tax=uncultured Alistipes sp. TaxID=538949 RepID=UPI0025E6719F|nr:radical SAM-associated putative lipoprotein [uncultured Alistipes sp.]
MKEKLLLAAAALLGFATACDSTKRQTDMYGTPYSNYKIKGKVTDKAGQPIKGIEVRSNAYLPTPEATTAADGTYDLSGKGVGNTARVTLTDTDGPANGGDFAAKTVTVEFTEADRTAKGKGWDRGSFAKSGVDITLEEKE